MKTMKKITTLQKLTELFLLHDKTIEEKLDTIKAGIFSENTEKADNSIKNICQNVIKNVFAANEWFELYANYEDYVKEKPLHDGDYYCGKVKQLFKEYIELI